MKPLEPPDRYHLRAAVGWLELGRHIEANEELEQITAQLRAHPDVLKVRWRVYAKAEKRDACLEIARALTEMEPDKPGGWIDHAQSLHRHNRTQEAHELLASIASRFPNQITILYHFAVYGFLAHAPSWSQAHTAGVGAQHIGLSEIPVQDALLHREALLKDLSAHGEDLNLQTPNLGLARDLFLDRISFPQGHCHKLPNHALLSAVAVEPRLLGATR